LEVRLKTLDLCDFAVFRSILCLGVAIMSRRKIEPTYRFHRRTGKAIVTYYDASGQRRSPSSRLARRRRTQEMAGFFRDRAGLLIAGKVFCGYPQQP
jgi:hypothetical protein